LNLQAVPPYVGSPLFTTTSFGELVCQLKSPLVLSAVLISLETSLTVVFLALCLGIPVAYLLAMKDFKGKEILGHTG
jgi:molybdate transport system permease protein